MSHHQRKHRKAAYCVKDQKVCVQKVNKQVVESAKVDKQSVEKQVVDKLAANVLNVERETIERLTVAQAQVGTLTVVGSGGQPGELNVSTINTRDLFINNKLFPTSIIPFKISGPTVIVGTNGACQGGDCPPATPGTPNGGLFVLGNSFTGKVTFCGVEGLNLNLANLVLDNPDDFALEFINCNNVLVYNGAVNSANGVAVRVSCCSDVTFKRLNTTDSAGALFIENSLNVRIKYWYMAGITNRAIEFVGSRYLDFHFLDINNVVSIASTSLIQGSNSDMIFINNCAFYNINLVSALGLKSILAMDTCFDVKVSHISILGTSVEAVPNTDLTVYFVYFTNCGSMVLGSFIIDGDRVSVSGTGSATFSCLRMEECNNVFTAHFLMTDNFVSSSGPAPRLTFQAISVRNVETFTLNGSKINTNYVEVADDATVASVRSFYGEEVFVGQLRAGNWYLSGNICNQHYVFSPTSTPVQASAYGFEVVNVSSTVVFQNSSSNNNGNQQNNLTEAGGFKVTAVDAANNTQTNINFFHCASNQNNSNSVIGTTAGFTSTYSNTIISGCEAISNTAGGECYGLLLHGLNSVSQLTVSLFKCTASTNFSFTANAYGVYAGTLGTNARVETLVIKSSTFSANGGAVGGYGVYLSEVVVSSIMTTLMNQNNFGLYIDGGSANEIKSNSALNNNIGIQVNESPDSILDKNICQSNDVGFADNTVTGNTYYANKSVSNTVSFDTVGFVIPLFAYNKLAGTFSFVSGEPTLNAFTNLSS